MDIMKKIDKYFDSVSDETLLVDLREAGFVLLSSQELYRAEGTGTVTYSNKRTRYSFTQPIGFFCTESEPAA